MTKSYQAVSQLIALCHALGPCNLSPQQSDLWTDQRAVTESWSDSLGVECLCTSVVMDSGPMVPGVISLPFDLRDSTPRQLRSSLHNSSGRYHPPCSIQSCIMPSHYSALTLFCATPHLQIYFWTLACMLFSSSRATYMYYTFLGSKAVVEPKSITTSP
jgi:hypothetical protein